MAAGEDSFLDLERHRVEYEKQILNQTKLLDFWKQLQQEYDALRTDVNSLEPSPSPHELKKVRDDYKGELLKEKELDDIFGSDKTKKAEQILSKLTNRLDYVGKNVATLTKQVEDLQKKLSAVEIVANPGATDEDGLPITEIMEELDDDDNVVSYSLRTPGDQQPQILEALKKAGITDFSPPADTSSLPESSQETPKPSKEIPSITIQKPDEDQNSELPKETQVSLATQPTEPKMEEAPKSKPAPKKKGVTFSEDTKPALVEEQSDTAKRLEEILKKARDQQSIISDPIMPADESEEDAALREDMLRYNRETMEFEMAPIVAELTLDSDNGSDDEDDYSDYDEGDDDDDEDEFGMTKLRVDDEWRKRMLELKEKLTDYDFGKHKASNDEDEMVEGIGRISIKREGQATPDVPVETKSALKSEVEDTASQDTKKSVRFAQSLDIAEETAPVAAPAPMKEAERPEVDPLSEVVMERTSGAPQPVVAPSSKKTSRFRKERSKAAPMNMTPVALGGAPILPDQPDIIGKETPSGPGGQTLATSVLEHEPSSEPKEPDEFDANLLHKQASEEYYKIRNKLVHRQGGFMKENKNPVQPLDEEEGGPKRMSRFKAARLAQQS
ncbi:Prefoldin subunit-domain-containing protein [Hypoxylon trugodes]|uniref:Prefoldin subunit-domain-containing protein n=1 Tax=Hypoxylon trugodes TaxID=326681 RepID=UPI00219C496E|nr:Prefoldin subunit-domain-containing protein [Hypoxylon trugodes]KAI1384205.1 Prefoldin subunit-domain-containing protein [Hypoxylon trugodes]